MKRTHAEDKNGNQAQRLKLEEVSEEVSAAPVSPKVPVITTCDPRFFDPTPIPYILSFDQDLTHFSLKPNCDNLNVNNMFNVARIFRATTLDLSNHGLSSEMTLEAATANINLIRRTVIKSQIDAGARNISCDFSGHRLSEDDLIEIFDTLRLSDEALFSLNLKSCGIDDAKMAIISQFLTKEDSILELNLDDNNIGNAGFVGLAEAIKNLRNLEKVTLKSNQIGCAALTPKTLGFFAVNNNLAHVDLDDNPIAKAL